MQREKSWEKVKVGGRKRRGTLEVDEVYKRQLHVRAEARPGDYLSPEVSFRRGCRYLETC
jgi:hypothetical protein